MTSRGEDWAYELRNRIQLDFNSFIWKLRNLLRHFKSKHPLFTEEDQLILWQKVIDMVKLFYENKDYNFDEELLIDAHYQKALDQLYGAHEQWILLRADGALLLAH